jgi:hypothetical protein
MYETVCAEAEDYAATASLSQPQDEKAPPNGKSKSEVKNLDKQGIFDAIGKQWEHAVAILDE